MGVSQTTAGTQPTPAAVLSSRAPEVRVEEATESDDEQRVFVEGTMFHDGLNKNAWGLSEDGAEEIANDLLGNDYVAAHPPVRNGKYDRSIAGGPGFPIGEVVSTNVVNVEGAMLDGGGYTAEYVAEVTDPLYASRYASGQFDGDDYSVSIGIYGDPEAANCSVCGHQMASDECGHDRFDEVEVEVAEGETETQIAGPLYDSGESDHLAAVYMAAYEGATAGVDTASAGQSQVAADGGLESASADSAGDVPHAASILAEPFGTPERASEDPEGDETDDSPTVVDGYQVRFAGDSSGTDDEERDSYRVRLQ